jgi:hypothetical protein
MKDKSSQEPCTAEGGASAFKKKLTRIERCTFVHGHLRLMTMPFGLLHAVLESRHALGTNAPEIVAKGRGGGNGGGNGMKRPVGC